MSSGLTIRLATEADLGALRQLMTLSIDRGQAAVLTPRQIVASRAVMGLDTQLVRDGTYFVVEDHGVPVGCGGWSRRATLYGGDHSTDLRDPALLDPAKDAARIRAMYTHPDHVRRGIGRMILHACEKAAQGEGFAAVELMGTAGGVLLYTACGYEPVERADTEVDGVVVPLTRMRKRLRDMA
ncbi:GNAT family N-acetyltransferase [Sphingomonas sp. SORGH_AS_0879]|uniref:GNAT family N-acetyltransferase n=1 Tax=Sphingomonas sp. SORGH_AS_0879 TaxID=3041790 RepID=UPI002782DEA4|nr:GNAT family N-acetyltransferase [Sphingomonas sp. SORGH_AS_0879]MDQ1230738.1 GNAT superfamily N-acetyltransferase [Sphingomonas sp. SORGH_AS_0879]